jgi:hypothetical protein
MEIEANFKAILRENTNRKGLFRKEEEWNINDYVKINITHHLDNYCVEFPIWRGRNNKYKPFECWGQNKPLPWYQAYNKVKHDRDEKFELANFENLITAFAGLFVLLSSQFNRECFSPGTTTLGIGTDSYYEGDFGLGEYLKIQFPTNWEESEKYDFDWSILKTETKRFEKIDYNKI